MKKYLLLSAVALFSAGMIFAQSSLAGPDPTIIGNDSAEQSLRTVLVDDFEREGSWVVNMSLDAGVISSRLLPGGPMGKEDERELLQGEEDIGEKNHCFGVKAEFFRRGINSIYIRPVRPIALEGVTKTLYGLQVVMLSIQLHCLFRIILEMLLNCIWVLWLLVAGERLL